MTWATLHCPLLFILLLPCGSNIMLAAKCRPMRLSMCAIKSPCAFSATVAISLSSQ
jgi:hypothetical protein